MPRVTCCRPGIIWERFLEEVTSKLRSRVGTGTELRLSCLLLEQCLRDKGWWEEKLIQNASIPGTWWTVVSKATFPIPRRVRRFYRYTRRRTKERGR